jgi:hypothetical protein
MSKAPTYVSGYAIERSVSAYQQEAADLRFEQLQTEISEDPSLATDEDVVGLPVAGTQADPTPLPVLLARLVDMAVWADRRAEESENLKKRYLARQQRYETRAEKIRATIADLMGIMDVTAYEGELGTVDLSQSASHVIADVNLIPEQYVREKVTREPDKVAIGRDLKAGQTIEGASMSNPKPVVRITPY